ncbi:Lrp/AsnC family transcriptional regulator [Ensifer sp. LCM 4579]|uniref:Lrp/AsnC family transcriptional regulator n=1 Tax=Ensifer sp. LCM 4579 TaxID=1848292 RepID=UPI0009F39F12|nr:Lrp/AsnC family transcriptional regulator [Ensifer sp. LCM 4579]
MHFPRHGQIGRRSYSVVGSRCAIEATADIERVGISLSACQRRIKTLEQSGVVSGYKAVIDPNYLGEGLVVFVLVSLERHSKDGVRAFEAAVSRLPMIKEIYHVAGEYDFIMKVAVADIKITKFQLR